MLLTYSTVLKMKVSMISIWEIIGIQSINFLLIQITVLKKLSLINFIKEPWTKKLEKIFTLRIFVFFHKILRVELFQSRFYQKKIINLKNYKFILYLTFISNLWYDSIILGNFTKLKKILSFFKLFAGIVALANAKDMYVVGGGVVAPHSETYILSLQRFSSHFCGATLITANYGEYIILSDLIFWIILYNYYFQKSKKHKFAFLALICIFSIRTLKNCNES